MSYSDIMSDGGMDPRNKLDESMYRLTVAQRDAAWREVELWRKKYEGLTKLMADHMMAMTHPPMQMLADKESYEAGRIKGQMDVADHLREDHAQLVEAMGMQGYGTLAIAAAIRRGKS